MYDQVYWTSCSSLPELHFCNTKCLLGKDTNSTRWSNLKTLLSCSQNNCISLSTKQLKRALFSTCCFGQQGSPLKLQYKKALSYWAGEKTTNKLPELSKMIKGRFGNGKDIQTRKTRTRKTDQEKQTKNPNQNKNQTQPNKTGGIKKRGALRGI